MALSRRQRAVLEHLGTLEPHEALTFTTDATALPHQVNYRVAQALLDAGLARERPPVSWRLSWGIAITDAGRARLAEG